MRTRHASIPARPLKMRQKMLPELGRARHIALLLALALMEPMAVSARPATAAPSSNDEATATRQATFATLEACVDQKIGRAHV